MAGGLGSGAAACPLAQASRPLTAAERSQAERSETEWSQEEHSQAERSHTEGFQLEQPPGSLPPPAAGQAAADYRDRIALTPWGPARLLQWCVWLEPGSGPAGAAATPWEQRWHEAVEAALASWQPHLPITRVADPQRAQLLIRRRRPPRRPDASGRLRASHGRAELAVLAVQRDQRWWLEPQVVLQISPDQRQQGIQATALHELGHGFGLWGHSDQPGDAMAAVPGAQPVLTLSARDLATLAWLQAQPSGFGQRLETALGAPLPGQTPPDQTPPGQSPAGQSSRAGLSSPAGLSLLEGPAFRPASRSAPRPAVPPAAAPAERPAAE